MCAYASMVRCTNLSEDEISLEKTFKHTIEIIIDRVVVKPGVEGRLAEAVELAIDEGDGLAVLNSSGAGLRTAGQAFQHKARMPGAWREHRRDGAADILI